MKIFPPQNYPQSKLKKNNKIVFYWLTLCAFLIFVMIVLGGITRLTHSGLSIVEWKPIMGIIPPLSYQQWLEAFGKYQQFPEFKIVNPSMSLAEFKSIFYFEYFHRMLGRLIGFFFLFPLLFFWFKRYLSKTLFKKLILVFILGGAQGVLGWYMVKSGLISEPQVSHYRLTAHLALAVLLYGVLIWTALTMYFEDSQFNLNIHPKYHYLYLFLPCLIYFMILSGGFVAGRQAGLIWNTFPFMGETLIPSTLYMNSSIWESSLNDPTTIQFNHRALAYLIFIVSTTAFIFTLKKVLSPIFRRYVISFYIAVCCQITLGISTLLLFVPVSLASLHQATAIIVFTLSLVIAFIASKVVHE